MADIFISYARENAAVTELLAATLETHGRSVFWDRRIPTGVRYDIFIAERLAAARCVIVLWSAAACVSAWVIDEAADANRRGVLLPALIEPIEPPLGLRRINAADLVGWSGSPEHPGLQRLFADISRLLDGPAAGVTPTPAAAPLRPAAKIDGRWQGDADYPWGIRRTESFRFRTFGRTLTGTAGFLGVARPIIEGEIDGAMVKFVTRTAEMAGNDERDATRRYVGEWRGDTIELMLSTESSFSPHEPVEFTLRRETKSHCD